MKEVDAFRKQVQVVDIIGCKDEERIVEQIKALSQKVGASCSCEEAGEITRSIRISEAPRIHAEQPTTVEMDKAGYFVILPQPERRIIVVEHYSYNNTLQRVIEGRDARSIYWTIIRNGWLKQLSHAAYLGKELAKIVFIFLGGGEHSLPCLRNLPLSANQITILSMQEVIEDR